MITTLRIAVLAWSVLGCLPVNANEPSDWPGFRGPGGRGVAMNQTTATTWNVTDENDKSVRWRTRVPGLGHSSPTIIGDKIFLVTAVPANGEAPLEVGRNGKIAAADDNGEQTWWVLCYDKATGEERWRTAARKGKPKTTRHAKATHANTTIAATQDDLVVFLGSEGLFCYDHDGELKWQRDLGVINVSKYGIGWGYASSPAIHDDRIVLVCDDPDDPFLMALSLSDGKELWRKSRRGDCERSWGTPLIHEGESTTQIVVNGWPWIVSYDLASGDEVWRIEGGGDNPTPTPFVDDDRIYITSSHGGPSPIYAIKTNAQGNLSESVSTTDPSVVWKVDRGGSYMSTPVVWDEYLYLGHTNGVLRCYHAETGEKVYEERLASGASITGSLVAADDKVYCPSEDGMMYVIQAGPDFDLIATNDMGNPCLATPAISDGALYVRTTQTLVAIEPIQDSELTATDASSTRPNVLFIAVDDLRPSMGCYGDVHAITPHMDALASRGMLFERAYCQVAVCNPSRASLMTGLRPDTLGVWTLPIHFREAKPDAVTLPQWFRSFGYTAVSHGKIYHNPTPDPQSWSEPIRRPRSLPNPYPKGTRERVQAGMESLPANDWRKNNLRNPSTAAPDLPDSDVLDGARTDMAIEDLRRLGKQPEPFFLAMGYIRPHLAWVAPKKYWDMHDPAKLPVLVNQQVIPGTPAYAMHNNSEMSHYVDLIDMPKPWDEVELDIAKRTHLMHGYYACVSYIDAQIGRMIDALNEEGLADNTIVVLWSDHGWKLGEYRGWGKMTNYEIDARVPLLIVAPGTTAAGHSTHALAELLDIYPTLCDLAGIDTPDFVEGRSLVPVLNDAEQDVREEAMSQYYRRHEGREYMGYSMRTDAHRFIEWRDFTTGEVIETELYDHQSESSETTNIAATASPELIQRLTQRLLAVSPRRRLQMTPAIHSSPTSGRWKADLTIVNRTTKDLDAYPITPRGTRGRSRRIGGNAQVTFNARIGGVYVIESTDGTIHQIHSPAYPARDVVIVQ